MTPLEEYIIAEELISICKENKSVINTYNYKFGQLIETEYTLKDTLASLLETGINLLTILDYKDNLKKSFLIKEILNTDIDDDLKDLVLTKISKEKLNDLPKEEQVKLLRELVEIDSFTSISILFNIGLRIEQGTTDNAIEYELASNGEYRFFELLMEYQPDFDFSKHYITTYGNETLLDAVKEELNAFTGITSGYNEKLEKTEMCINNFIKIKNFNKLNEELPLPSAQKDQRLKI